MKKLLSCVVPITLSALALTACSGSGSSSTEYNKPKPPVKVHGVLGVGHIYNAEILAVPIDNQGQPFQPDGYFEGERTLSTKAGDYTTEFASDYINGVGILIAQYPNEPDEKATQNCEVKKGCLDGAFNKETTLDKDFRQTAVIGTIKDGMQININWITSLAEDFAYTSYIDELGNQGENPTTSKPGIYTVYTVERANLWLSKQFDLPDVISTTPIAPSKINQLSNVSANILSNGIRYGALLAAAQMLAKEGNVSEVELYKQVRDQQREHLGQLYINHDSDFSLCQLYGAAHTVLADHLNNNSPSVAQDELKYLGDKKTKYCADDVSGDLTNIEVRFDEIETWANIAKNSKRFVKDLNERLSNLKGDDANTCGKNNTEWSADPQDGCIASFFEPFYVKRTQDFHDPVKQFYQDNKAEFDKAHLDIRDYIFEFTSCLNPTEPAVSLCSGTYKPAADKKPATYTKDGLTFTLEPDDSVKDGEDRYFAFNFFINGSQSVAGKIISYKSVQPEDKNQPLQRPRVRVVYDEAYKQPPVTAIAATAEMLPAVGVQPLGFDYLYPEIAIDDFAGKSLKTLLAFKMIGVKPHQDFQSTNFPYHYNFTQLVLETDIKGDVIGKIDKEDAQDKAKINISIRTANGANYYANKVWPDLESDLFDDKNGDFYGADKAGGNVGNLYYDTIPSLFTYSLKQDEMIIHYYQCNKGSIDEKTGKCADGSSPSKKEIKADYMEIAPLGLGVNRYELFQNTASNGTKYQTLRSCSIDKSLDEAEQERLKICNSGQEVHGEEGDFDLLTDLFIKDDDGKYKYFSLFAFPGYGVYEPNFPEEIIWTGEQSVSIDGIRQAQYSQSLDDLSIQVDQKFVEKTGTEVKEMPFAIGKLTLSKRTPTSWEVAIALGYNYQYLVGPLPTGDKVQSLYFSYFVNETVDEDKKRHFKELSGLIVQRGGMTIFGDKNSNNGLTIGGNINYEEIDDGANKLGCGYLYKDNPADFAQCKDSAVAYLTFRSALVAVIREERKGEFIARFSDGDFIPVPFMGTLPKELLSKIEK